MKVHWKRQRGSLLNSKTANFSTADNTSSARNGGSLDITASLRCPIVLARPAEGPGDAPWRLRAKLVLRFLAAHPGRGPSALIIRSAQLVAPDLCRTCVEVDVSGSPLELWVHTASFEIVLGYDLVQPPVVMTCTWDM